MNRLLKNPGISAFGGPSADLPQALRGVVNRIIPAGLREVRPDWTEIIQIAGVPGFLLLEGDQSVIITIITGVGAGKTSFWLL